MTQAAHLTAVVVLYGQSPGQSVALSSLLEVAAERPDAAQRMSLVIYDNSPKPHEPSVSPPFETQYIHDAENAVSPAHTTQRSRVHRRKAAPGFCCSIRTRASPRNMWMSCSRPTRRWNRIRNRRHRARAMGGQLLYSPEGPFSAIFAGSSPTGSHPEENGTGMVARPLTAYNSGAALRVSALEADRRLSRRVLARLSRPRRLSATAISRESACG